MQFLSPISFLVLLLIPVAVLVAWYARRQGSYFRGNESLRKIIGAGKWRGFYLPLAVEALILALFATIAANPVTVQTKQEVSKKGIDIAIVFDISKSMLAEDIAPNRIGMAKKVVGDFVGQFTSDRIGLVLFAGKPFLSMPLTFDYSALTEAVERTTTDSIRQQVPGLSGTAIGDGLLVAIDILTQSGSSDKHPPPEGGQSTQFPPEKGGKGGFSESPERAKVIILLTDGEANMGVNPRAVAKLAKEKNIRIYTIGLGNPKGTELYVTDAFWQRQYFRDQNGNPIKATLDEKMLSFIAETTGGDYYNAQDEESLSSIFAVLGKLTKTEVKTSMIRTFTPEYPPILVALLVLLPIGIWLRRRWG